MRQPTDNLLHDLAWTAPSFPHTENIPLDPKTNSYLIYCLIHRSQRHQDLVYKVYDGRENPHDIEAKFLRDVQEKLNVERGFVSLINIDNVP